MSPGSYLNEVVFAVVIHLVTYETELPKLKAPTGPPIWKPAIPPQAEQALLRFGIPKFWDVVLICIQRILLPVVVCPAKPALNDEIWVQNVGHVCYCAILIAYGQRARAGAISRIVNSPNAGTFVRLISLLARVTAEYARRVAENVVDTDCAEILIDGIDLRSRRSYCWYQRQEHLAAGGLPSRAAEIGLIRLAGIILFGNWVLPTPWGPPVVGS